VRFTENTLQSTHLLDIFVMRIYNVSVKKAFNSKKGGIVMKKILKKILPVTLGIFLLFSHMIIEFSVSASYSFENYSALGDDKGMLSAYDDYGCSYQLYYNNRTQEIKNLIAVHKLLPLYNKFSFCLNNNINCEEADETITAIIKEYFPDIVDENSSKEDGSYIIKNCFDDVCSYTVVFSNKIIPDDERVLEAKEKSKAIMHKLNEKKLISAFYDIGDIFQDHHYTPVTYYSYIDSDEVDIINEYLSENQIECELMQDSDEAIPLFYSLVPSEDMTIEEYFSVVTDIYKNLEICPFNLTGMDIYWEINGKNSLELNTQIIVGDIDLDNDTGLADIVILSKYNSNAEIYPISDETARANADVNNDGEINSLDINILIEQLLGSFESAV